jgi:hypothetical protein
MASAPIRNPLSAFVLAILATALLSGVAGYASTFIPFVEFRLFALGFALFGIGALAGRRTFVGALSFVGTYLGAFVGLLLAQELFWFNPWQEIIALGLALAAGTGGFMMGKVGVHHLARSQRVTSGQRRCGNCGAKVGASAHKCWSCKAALTT